MILLMEEIRRSPVEVGSLSHGFCISRVVQDFFPVPKEIYALSCTSILGGLDKKKSGNGRFGNHHMKFAVSTSS